MAVAGGCWPTEEQTLLLRAALLDPVVARVAWARWRSRNTIEAADPASVRLLPLAYRNLEEASIDHADLEKLRSAYKATWVRNQILFRRASEALETLHDAGIQTMALKGVALVAVHYGDAGTRPMEDIDVLVRWPDFERAVAVLVRAGWRGGDEGVRRGSLRALHARHLQHPDGHSLDLHQFALAQSAVDDSSWKAAVDIEVLGVPTRAPCPADQLVHVLVHGVRWNALPPIRWIADAFVLERTAGASLDWDRVVAEASRRRVTAALSTALEHLVGRFGLDVPANVVTRVREAPKGRLELWAQRAALQPLGGGSWVPVVLDDYARRSRVDRSLRFDVYLQELLGAESRRDFARQVARKSAQAALTQSLMRVAPGRVVPCERCGRRVVRFRSAGTALCDPCDRGSVPKPPSTSSSRRSRRVRGAPPPEARSTRR